MRIALSLFGFEVFVIDVQTWEIEEDGDDEEPAGWSGQQHVSAVIETPMVRYDPDDRYRWDEEYRRRLRLFGFH